MPFSSGTFSVVYNWTTESGASPIEIAKLDTQHADFATGLSNCILRDGTGLPTAAIPFNSQNITGVAELQAARFVPTASTVPTNGMYLSAANTVAWATASTLRASVNSSGNWTFVASSSGSTILVNGVLQIDSGVVVQTISEDGSGAFLDISGSNAWRIFTNSTQRVSVGAAGNVTIAAPSSGVALAVTGVAGATSQTWTDGTRTASIFHTASRIDFGSTTGDILSLLTAGTRRVEIAAAGNVTINAPSSGNALTVNGFTAIDTGAITQSIQEDGSGALLDISGSNNWRIYTGGSERIRVGNTGNITVNAPSSGFSLQVNSAAAGTAIGFSDGTVTGWSADFGSTRHNFGTSSNHSSNWYSNNTQRVILAAGGNVTINAASSGDELTVVGSVVATSFSGALTGNVTGDVTGNVTGNASTATTLQTARTINGVAFNGSANITVTAAAETLTGTTLAALSGANLTALNATQLTSGTVPSARITAVDAAATINSIAIGYRTVPQNAQTGNYTAVIGDSGYHIYHASGAGAGDTYTIPANASVAYPVGTVLTFVNNDSNAVSIAITTDTMTLAGTTTTGTRTLAQNGIATAIKTTSTTWLISGTGLS